jgi:antitoxin component YwqK of YwqJK toxin-antitoxin module
LKKPPYIAAFGKQYDGLNGVVSLPDTGNYFVFPHGSYSNPVPVRISAGLNTMHYKDSIIMTSCCGVDQPPIYVSCGAPINGYKEDHYPDGKIKIRGTFREGRIKDSLVQFYENGKTREKDIQLSKQYITFRFDSNGNKLSYWHSFAIKPGKRYDHILITYYPDGKIKFHDVLKNRIHSLEKYYPNGLLWYKQTKKERTEYTDQGKISIQYTWKYVKDDPPAYKMNVGKKAYDTDGNVTEALTYEIWEQNGKTGFDIRTKPSWVTSYQKLQNGKSETIASEMDGSSFVTKYSWNETGDEDIY